MILLASHLLHFERYFTLSRIFLGNTIFYTFDQTTVRRNFHKLFALCLVLDSAHFCPGLTSVFLQGPIFSLASPRHSAQPLFLLFRENLFFFSRIILFCQSSNQSITRNNNRYSLPTVRLKPVTLKIVTGDTLPTHSPYTFSCTRATGILKLVVYLFILR